MKIKVIRSFVIIVFGLAIHFLASCSNINYHVIYFTNAFMEKDESKLIKTIEELNEYKVTLQSLNVDQNFSNKIDIYEGEFFEEKSLVIINLLEASSSNKIFVKKLETIDNKLSVLLKRERQSVSEDSIKIWTLVIEIEKQEIDIIEYKFI